MLIDTEQLKSIQRPLKDAYRQDAASALVTLSADAALDSSDVACSVQTGQTLAVAGLHPASGGDGSLACSGDMLLQALVACAGVTIRSVAVNRGIELNGGSVRAEGDLDFRGTMGVDRDVPVGFTDVRLTFDVTSDAASDEQLDELVGIAERYCVVLQTLVNLPTITVGRSTQ